MSLAVRQEYRLKQKNNATGKGSCPKSPRSSKMAKKCSIDPSIPDPDLTAPVAFQGKSPHGGFSCKTSISTGGTSQKTTFEEPSDI